MQITLRLRCDSSQLYDWLTVEAVSNGPAEEIYRCSIPVGDDLALRLEEASSCFRATVETLGFLQPGSL